MRFTFSPPLVLLGAAVIAAPVTASATILLNEIHLRTPASSSAAAADENYEFVELRSTTGGVEPCTDLWILVIDNEGGNVGEIQEAWPLRDADSSPLRTGSNGLLLIGHNYTLPDSPWATVKATQTTLGDPPGMGNDEFPDADAISILLVRGYTDPAPVAGATDVDIDMDNDGTGVPDWLDPTPPAARYTAPLWTEVVDSIGFNGDQGAVIKPAFSATAASLSSSSAVVGAPLATSPATTFYPHSLARSAGNNTANSRAAWYGGRMQGAAAAINSVIYSSDFFNLLTGQTWRGQATPGQRNFAAAPVAPVFRINEININPPGSPGRSPGGATPSVPEANDGNFEYIEIINTQANQAGGGNFSGSLNGFSLLMVDNEGGGLGVVRSAWNLGRFSTGSNGLLLLGDGYPAGFSPFAAAIEDNTQFADPAEQAAPAPNATRLTYSKLSIGDLSNDGVSYLLVQGWAGLVEQDLDANDDGALDTAPLPPWTTMLDSVCVPAVDTAGALVAGQSGYTAARPDIIVGGLHYNADNVSRIRGLTTAHVSSAWSAGLLGSHDAHALLYRNGFNITGTGSAFRAAASPGRANYSSASPPVTGSFLLNEVHINPPTATDNTEFIEVISTEAHALMTNLWIIVLDATTGASSGRVRKVIDLRGQATGPNRLAIFADGVEEDTSPLFPFISGRTVRDDAASFNANGTANTGGGFNFTPDSLQDDGVSVLLVSYTPPTATGLPATPDADLDANNDGVLDSAPPWTLVDGVSTGRGIGGAAALGASGFVPGSICRYAGNATASSADAWYGGELTGGSATSFGYSANFFGTFKGAASPGRHNVTTALSSTSSLLLNEVNINPPGGDNEKEFVELISTDGSAMSAIGHSILLIDNDGGDTGRVLKVFDLDSGATGTNGLLLAGVGYDSAVPWTGADAPNAATKFYAPDGMAFDDIGGSNDNGAITVLLVKNFTGRAGDDLDEGTQADWNLADDHILNTPLPWEELTDSVAMKSFMVTTVNNVTTYSLEGFVFPGTADLTVPIPAAPNQANGYTPDTLARKAGNNAANSAASWFGGNLAGTAGTSTVYDTAQFFPGAFIGGRVTPGEANPSGAPLIIPGNEMLGGNTGASAKLSTTSLAALASGGGGALTITAVQPTPTARGGRASLQGGFIIYEPAPGFTGVDSFNYRLSDGTSSVTGTVTVMMSTPGGPTKNVADILPENGGNRIAGFGIPGRTYGWQISGDLLSWIPLGEPSLCPASGLMSTFDFGPLPPTRFYRLVEKVAF